MSDEADTETLEDVERDMFPPSGRLPLGSSIYDDPELDGERAAEEALRLLEPLEAEGPAGSEGDRPGT